VTDVQAPPPASAQIAAPALDHVSAAIIAVLAGAGLAVTARSGGVALLVAVAVVQAALVAAWIIGTGLPGRIGAAVLAVMAAAAADTVTSLWPHAQLGALLAVFGLMMPVAFVHQLTRGVVRNRVVESLADIATLIVSVVALTALIQLRHELLPMVTAFTVVLVAAVALALGDLVDLIFVTPRFDPNVRRGLPAVIAGGLAGGVLARLELGGQADFTAGRAIFLGAAIGVLAGLFAVGSAFIQAATSIPRSGRAVRWQPVFGALLPLALVSPVAYLLCLSIHS